MCLKNKSQIDWLTSMRARLVKFLFERTNQWNQLMPNAMFWNDFGESWIRAWHWVLKIWRKREKCLRFRMGLRCAAYHDLMQMIANCGSQLLQKKLEGRRWEKKNFWEGPTMESSPMRNRTREKPEFWMIDVPLRQNCATARYAGWESGNKGSRYAIVNSGGKVEVRARKILWALRNVGGDTGNSGTQ